MKCSEAFIFGLAVSFCILSSYVIIDTLRHLELVTKCETGRWLQMTRGCDE